MSRSRLTPAPSPARLVRRDRDRKSTRLNSSHSQISYAVFCLKKKKNNHMNLTKHENKRMMQHMHHIHPDRDKNIQSINQDSSMATIHHTTQHYTAHLSSTIAV